MHAAVTAEVVADHLSDPLALALAHDSRSRERVLPWLRGLWQQHVQLRDQFTAVIEGRPPASPGTDPVSAALRDLNVALTLDPDVFRAYMEITSGLALPQEVLARPSLAARVRELAEGQSIPPPPGPTRAELLTMLT
jgi:hypothetical protein